MLLKYGKNQSIEKWFLGIYKKQITFFFKKCFVFFFKFSYTKNTVISMIDYLGNAFHLNDYCFVFKGGAVSGNQV